MRYLFRGYSTVLDKWVFGTGCDQTEHSVQIYDKNSVHAWTYVDPKTFGRKCTLTDASKTEVYQGDIVRYSFKSDDATFHRYYIVKEDEHRVYCEEVWRDYELDPDTFKPIRCKNIKFAGETKATNSFSQYGVCDVVGNVWQNSEFL